MLSLLQWYLMHFNDFLNWTNSMSMDWYILRKGEWCVQRNAFKLLQLASDNNTCTTMKCVLLFFLDFISFGISIIKLNLLSQFHFIGLDIAFKAISISNSRIFCYNSTDKQIEKLLQSFYEAFIGFPFSFLVFIV